MSSCGFMSYGMMQDSLRGLSCARRTRTILVDWVKIAGVFAQSCGESKRHKKERKSGLNNLRRLSGPLCVSATPKRAVRVGKTQSAFSAARVSVCSTVSWMEEVYHINSKSYANQEVYLGAFVRVYNLKYMLNEPSANPIPIEYRGPERRQHRSEGRKREQTHGPRVVCLHIA